MTTAMQTTADNGTTQPRITADLVVHDAGPNAILLDSGRFAQAQRIASLMATSSLLPEHLAYTGTKGGKTLMPQSTRIANCFRIVNQAFRWGLDPFAIVDSTYVVGGKLAYEGKLVAALVNSRAGLKGRLTATYSGSGDDRTVTVHGTFEGESAERTAELRLADARTENQMWRKDPDQKLWYSAVVKWARRHCPEVVLGVLTDDDLDRMRLEGRIVDVTSVATPQIASDGRSASDRLADRLMGTPSPADGSYVDESQEGTCSPSEPSGETQTTDSPAAPASAEPSEPYLEILGRLRIAKSRADLAEVKQLLLASKAGMSPDEHDQLSIRVQARLAEAAG